MKETKIELPVPVLSDPHWRVNLRTNEYEKELGHSWSFQTDELIAESAEKALTAILWFF